MKTPNRTACLGVGLLLSFVFLAGSMCLLLTTVHAGTYTTKYVPISSGTPGVLYEPDVPVKSDVALLIMHNFSDSLQHVAAVQLAQRGHRILAANTVYANNPSADEDWDRVLLQVRDAVRYLRNLSGVTKVILIGHSSGAPMMAAYQSVAENGPGVCQGPEKIVKCPDSFAGFPRADGLILLDPVFGGMGVNVLCSIDPALVSEENAQVVNPSLDMFDPRNGFDANGATYPEGFRRRFLAKQAQEMNRLIDEALKRLEMIQAGKGRYADDEPFIVPAARPTVIKLWRPDLHLLAHTRAMYTLLTKNGPVGPQIIQSVRVPSGTTRTTGSYNDAGLTTSVRRFLSTFATRTTVGYDITEDNITGVDWQSSYGSTPGNVEGVHVPLLILGMTGHYWIVSSEIAYEHAASADKTVAFVEGATHGITECVPCRVNNNGQPFGDTVKTTFDYIASWLGPRF